jgi:hypothetical protein
MALQFTVNQLPATGADAIFRLKAALKAAGWTVLRSSDGTTYNASRDQISQAGSGAGGMANNLAWFVIRQPAGTVAPFAGLRQLCIQRGNTFNTQWRVKYSFSAGFSGGSPGATQTPGATDEQIVAGTGTDASPSFAAFFAADGGYNLQIAVGNVEPFGFWAVAYPTGGGNPNGALMMDPMQPGFPSQDDDPYVLFFCSSVPFTGGNGMNYLNYGTPPKGFLKHGMSGEAFVGIAGAYLAQTSSGTLVFPDGAGSNPHNGKDDLMPAVYARSNGQTVPIGFKGLSTFVHFRSVARATGDTMSAPAAKDHIVIGQVVFDWDGVTTPSV